MSSVDERKILTLVTDEDDGDRLDAYLGSRSALSSRSLAVKLIEQGNVSVNGAVILSKKHLVYAGDKVEALLPEPTCSVLVPDNIPLDIRFEDEHLIVLSKQTGLVCHPSVGHERGTLANALVAHCGIHNLGMLQGEDRPGIVHRLDRDTSGLMLAAKSDEVQKSLQDAIRLRSVDRRYLTLVHGFIAPDTGMIDAPIGRHEKDRTKMTISYSPSARQAITTFTVLERFEAGRSDEGFTLLECKLYTGRTHQIRVHMSSINHPCIGDPLYGSKRLDKSGLLDRQFLHSYRISFEHPVTAEQITLLDPLPWDLEGVLEQIEERSMGKTEAGIRISQELLAERLW